VLGRTCLLYKRHPQKPVIVLPRGGTVPASAASPAGSLAVKAGDDDGLGDDPEGGLGDDDGDDDDVEEGG
jgi:hypothetical protein